MAFGYAPDVHAIASQCIDKVFGKPKSPVGATDHLTCTQLLRNVLTKFSEKPKLPVGATDHLTCTRFVSTKFLEN